MGPSSSQLKCLKGNYHWCCFPFLSGHRASWRCHGPPATREELPSPLPTRHLDSGEDGAVGLLMWGKRQSGWLAVLNPTCPLSGSLSPELIVNPIKAGNTVYWFTSLNTHSKRARREYIMCKFTHKWLSRPQNIHIIYNSARWIPNIKVYLFKKKTKKTAAPHSPNL